MKQVIDLRPVYHRKEERIRAHVMLAGSPCCSSASPRPPPAPPGTRSPTSSDLLTLGTFTGPAGTFRQTADLTQAQRDLLARLSIPQPEEDHPGRTRSP